jgi:hypothetical protein
MSRARSIALAALVAAGSLIPAAVRAQAAGRVAGADPRQGFEDSWYWGAKGGVLRFGTETEGYVQAPLAGGEWLITHRQGALLVGAEQAFFDRTSAVFDAQADDGMRQVRIRDARRYSVAAIGFPIRLGVVRPYAGLGAALEVIRSARPEGDFNDQGQYNAVAELVDRGQSRTAAFVILGAQAQVGRAALFVQGSASGAQARSLWNRGGTAQLEAGVRFNLAPAFER